MNRYTAESAAQDPHRQPSCLQRVLGPAPRPKTDPTSVDTGWHGYDHSYDSTVRSDTEGR